MGVKLNRIGEENINNFGSKMIIIEYRGALDVDIYFPEYDWITTHKTYDYFKKGKIKCPYEKRTYSIGYIGEGKYKSKINGKYTKVYKTWHSMLQRCYDKEYHNIYPTYIDCETSEEFHNFQNYGKWFDNNYYEIEGEKMCLDKDILIKHNKIYSPETCIFVPETINNLFTKRNNARGESCIGTTFFQGKYVVQCHLLNFKTGKSKREYLGRYDTEEKAFEVYKYYKEKNIKQVADYYRKQIPEILYNVLYNYEVEIDD